MADRTGIEWCDATINPIRAQSNETGRVGWFCEHATPGCERCYAEAFNRRLGTGIDFKRQNRGRVTLHLFDSALTQPLRWRKPRRIFWNSMTDTFGDFVPDEFIDRQFAVMALTPQHTHLVLTKRARRMREYFTVTGSNDDPDAVHQRILTAAYDQLGEKDRGEAERLRDLCEASDPPLPLPNVWLGVSVEDQARADERIPDLLATPAAKRFISAEPLLGPVDLKAVYLPCCCEARAEYCGPINCDAVGVPRLDWVIVGGESGPGARPMHPDWARSLRDQCAAAGVPFFFKQWGEYAPAPEAALDTFEKFRVRGARDNWIFNDGTAVDLVGKSRAGRLLHGREYSEFPT